MQFLKIETTMHGCVGMVHTTQQPSDVWKQTRVPW